MYDKDDDGGITSTCTHNPVHMHACTCMRTHVQVRAAFMFDMYDKDDDGGITLKELSDLIHNCQPGSLVEQVRVTVTVTVTVTVQGALRLDP